ncbi:hypothetical protein OG453_29750 [Streptomyces sp. NBC_01381]|uniref:RICIN domain-containing protein n=1 Tax=Streptomyces sp. NBC_01381 TaxID=2903845 RepID=UPI002259F887|nr:RICIN domain-containing protein [Streptomyces sp. NBC_01381]MCX4670830.1 hypothetical protein [Streptomyces sp. NBC_01381]
MAARKRFAVLASTASLCLAAGAVSAGEAQAAGSWRSLKFQHGKNICLSVQAKASTKKGKRERVRGCTGGVYQLWRIDFSKYNGRAVAKLHPATNTKLCLDGAKTERMGRSGWLSHVTKCNSSASQKWQYVSSNPGAYFNPQNVKSKLCLGAYKGRKSSGTWVGTSKCNSKVSGGQIFKVK